MEDAVVEDRPAAEGEEEKEVACSPNCYWVSCGLGAGACMGTGAFVYAPEYAKYGLAGTGVLGPGTFVLFLLWRLALEIRYRARTGVWLKPEGSRAWENGKPKWKTLIPWISNALTNAGYLVVMSFAWNFAKEGGLNQGVVSTLLSFTSVMNSINFYCFFGEKLSLWQGLGICLMIGCILCLGLAASN